MADFIGKRHTDNLRLHHVERCRLRVQRKICGTLKSADPGFEEMVIENGFVCRKLAGPIGTDTLSATEFG